jgi:PEP-CTERM motif
MRDKPIKRRSPTYPFFKLDHYPAKPRIDSGSQAVNGLQAISSKWRLAMKTKLLRFISSIAIGLLSSIGVANADTITVFNVKGSFASVEFAMPPLTPPVALTGTLTIDVTVGTVTDSDLLIPTFSPLNAIDSQETVPNDTGLLYQLTVKNTIGDSGYIDLIVPNEQSNPLIGHRDIDIDQGEFTSHSGTVTFGLTGSITAVPEPATWAMMLLGLLGIGFPGFRRTRNLPIAAA